MIHITKLKSLWSTLSKAILTLCHYIFFYIYIYHFPSLLNNIFMCPFFLIHDSRWIYTRIAFLSTSLHSIHPSCHESTSYIFIYTYILNFIQFPINNFKFYIKIFKIRNKFHRICILKYFVPYFVDILLLLILNFLLYILYIWKIW